MSFHEKSAWTCLVTTIVVFVPYFAYIFQLFLRGELLAPLVLTMLAAAVLFQVILISVAHTWFIIRSGQKQDERDIAIQSKSFRNAYFALASSIWIIWIVVFIAPWSAPLRDFLAFGQALLLCFILAEVTHYLTQIICYRRGS